MSKPKPLAEEFDPKGFGQFNDPVLERQLHPWRQLGRHAMMFQMAVAGKEDIRNVVAREEISAEVNRRCDDFITAFVDAPDRTQLTVPSDLRGYLTLRAIKALLVCKYKEEARVPPPPFYKENFRKEILELLIDAWYSDRYDEQIQQLSQPKPKRPLR